MGLAPRLVAEIFVIIRSLKEAATAILIVDQNALAVADRAYVLEIGSIALAGRGAWRPGDNPTGQLIATIMGSAK